MEKIGNKTGLLSKLIGGLLILLSIVYLLPYSFYGTLGSGLDPSWLLALHMAIDAGREFGTEFVFTHGPLGFLSMRLPFASTYYSLIAFDIFFWLSILFVFFTLLRSGLTLKGKLALFLICFLSGYALYFQDIVIALFSLLLFYLFSFLRTEKNIWLVLAGINSALIFYNKLNFGLAAIACMLGVFAFMAVFEKEWKFSAFATTAYLLFLSGLSLLFSIDLLSYLRASLEIVSGHNETMALYQADKEPYLWTALSLIAIYISCLLLNIRQIFSDWRTFLMTGLATGFAFLIYKQSFTRADEHVFIFFSFFVVPLALLVCFTSARLKKSLSIVFALCVLPVFCFLPSQYFTSSKLSIEEITRKLNGLSTYITTVSAGLPEDSRAAKTPKAAKLPAELLVKIGDSTIDILPWNIAYAYFNKLNYEPRPVPQSYLAYTSYLDNLNRDKYLSGSAPEKLIFAGHCTDYRYCFWDESQTKLAMLSAYESKSIHKQHILLEKRKERLKVSVIQEKSYNLELGKWHKLEKSDGLLYGKFTVDYSLLGKLSSMFFQTPSLKVSFRTSRRRKHTFRTARPILSTGVLIEKYLDRLKEMNLFFRNEMDSLRDVTAIMIHSPDNWGFKSEIQLKTQSFQVKKRESL